MDPRQYDGASGAALGTSVTVLAWGKGLAAQWGGDPLAEDPAKLAALADFCQFCGKSPDELVAFCFLRKRATAEAFVSVQRRRAVAELLRAFQDVDGGIESRRRVANVLSFLIHNGIMMHTGMIATAPKPGG